MGSPRFARVKSLLFAVADMSTEERAAYLTEHEEDPKIREEVESLLQHEASAVFGTGARVDPEPTIEGRAGARPQPGHSLVGTRIGAYELLAELGRGGMGVVYRARSVHREEELALKVLPEHSKHPDRLERFAAEARLLASLNHPNVAGIHTVEQEGDVHFLTMELIEGESLAERLSRGPLSLEEVLPIARQIASALEAAHARGIVHRDVKPLNVMIRPDGQIRVLDFGIAKALRGEESLPAHGLDRPAPGVDRPAPGVDRPASGADRPASGVGRPASGVDRPASGVGRPASGVDRPASGVDRPAPGVDRPAPDRRRASHIDRLEPDHRRAPESLATQPSAEHGSSVPHGADRSLIAGTPGYMSPERLTGAAASERADIWSFGCVLYECLVGRLPFRGSTLAETLRATLETEPLLEDLPSSTPLRLRELLQRCLAKDPEGRIATMRALRREIDEMMEETALESGASIRRVSEENVSKTNLPRRLTSFIGREREREEIAGLLREERLVTLTGFGGYGKTRLSLEVAEGLVSEFPDGIWQIELASVGAGTLVPDAIQSALGVEPGRTASVTETVIRHLKGQVVLLLLDNCEHVRAGCADFLTQALAELPSLRVLTTSRGPIGLTGERVYEVGALTVPRAGEEGDGQSEAVRLFLDRARAARSDFAPSAEDGVVVAEICRRLDGIPLAIELAAARIRMGSLEELASGLDQALGVLAGGSLSTLPRHQTLRGVIDWSYAQLGSEEKALLRRLSVFAADGWTRAAGEAVCAGELVGAWEVTAGVDRLVEKSLVQRQTSEAQGRGKSRSRLLETVRAYAREKLDESGEAAEAFRRHREYYVDLVETGDRQIGSAEQKEWVDRLEAEQANIIQAIDWSCGEREGVPCALRLAALMRSVWGIRGHYALGRDVLGRVLALDSAGEPTAARAEAALGAGTLAHIQGDLDEARRWCEEAIRVQRLHGDRKGETRSLVRIGEVLKERGEIDEARLRLEEALRIQRELGDEAGVAGSLTALGNVYDDMHNDKAALRCYEESLRIRRQLGAPAAIADSLHNVASIRGNLGDEARAREAFGESLAIRRELGDRRGVAASLNNLGILTENGGDYERARRLYDESLAIKRELGNPRGIVSSLANLGHVVQRLGELDLAKSYLDEAVEISRGLGPGRALATCLENLGSVERERGDFARSHRLFEEALGIRRSMGDRRDAASALLGMGEAAQGSGDLETARRLFAESMAARCEAGYLGRIAEQLEASAWLELSARDAEEAAHLFGMACSMRDSYGLTLLEEERAKEDGRMGEVRVALGTERFEEAFERGRRTPLAEAIERVLAPLSRSLEPPAARDENQGDEAGSPAGS